MPNQANRSFSIKPSNTDNHLFNWIRCSGAGNITVNFSDAPTVDVVIPMESGSWYPVAGCMRVKATGTTATGLVAA